MENIKVLITGAGSTMGQSVLKALLESKFSSICEVTVTNSDVMGAGFFMAEQVKHKYLVPIAKDPTYIDVIIEICNKEQIQAIFSGTEHEIMALSHAAQRIYKESGAYVLLSRPEVIEIGTDKWKTYLFFKENGIPFPETALFSDYKKLVDKVGYPLFMKPRTASASRNIYKITCEEELEEYRFDNPEDIILQEYLDSDIEYTVGVVCDKNGECGGVIPMRRELQYGASYWGLIDHNEEAIQVSKLVADKLRPEGAMNVQLRMVDGKAIPFEINTRFSSSECVRAHYGFNAVEAVLDNYLFNAPIDLSGWKSGMFARYFHECYFDEEQMNEIKDGKNEKN